MKRICSVVMIIMLGILLWGCSQKTENQELVEEIAGGIYQPNGIVYPTPEPRILPSSIGGEMNWRFPAFSAPNLVELR